MITKLAAVLLIAMAAFAQQTESKPAEPPPQAERGTDLAPNADARRFLFTLVELENGRKLNSRSFEMFVREDRNSNMKTGSRVPVLGNTQQVVDYIEVGLNVRVQYKLRRDGKLDLTSTVEMSSIATPASDAGPHTHPVVRQTQSSVTTTLAPDTPTIIDRIEDLASGHTFELSVVAREK